MPRRLQRASRSVVLSHSRIRSGRTLGPEGRREGNISPTGAMRSKSAVRRASSAWWPPGRPVNSMMRGSVPVTVWWDTLSRQPELATDTWSRWRYEPTPERQLLDSDLFEEFRLFHRFRELPDGAPAKNSGTRHGKSRIDRTGRDCQRHERITAEVEEIGVNIGDGLAESFFPEVGKRLHNTRVQYVDPLESAARARARPGRARAFGLNCRSGLTMWAARNGSCPTAAQGARVAPNLLQEPEKLFDSPLTTPRGLPRPAVHQFHSHGRPIAYSRLTGR